ncbi:MAG: gluconolaconase [Rhizobium sp.]|nr:gluconolaconase [Rhizobium sp.]
MMTIQPFNGKILSDVHDHLGEGPMYDQATDTAWWLNILDSELIELHIESGRRTVHSLPAMASVVARVDGDRQMLATENGLYLRDIATGKLTLTTPIEDDRNDMRSNDGRVHPSGALWFGTMKKTNEGRKGAGSIYHVARGVVTRIFPQISIPNGICFSPDGTVGYYVDTMENRYMRVPVDPLTGLPTADPQIFSDESQNPGGVDGSVCDTDGYIWNARWEVGQVHRFSPNGELTAVYSVPSNLTTCPVFIGKNADRMLVTSGREGLDAEAMKADPQAGFTYDLGITVNGAFEPAYKI